MYELTNAENNDDKVNTLHHANVRHMQCMLLWNAKHLTKYNI